MFKFTGVVLGLSVLCASAPLMAQTAEAAPLLGPDAAVCRRGDSPSVLVHIPAFKQRTGKLRVQIYGSNPADFLAKGKWLRRVDLPVAHSGAMDVCVALPRPGNYAVAVRHDLDGNGKSGWSDGGGFSRNPSLAVLPQAGLSQGRDSGRFLDSLGRGLSQLSPGPGDFPGQVGQAYGRRCPVVQPALDRKPAFAAACPQLLRQPSGHFPL